MALFTESVEKMWMTRVKTVEKLLHKIIFLGVVWVAGRVHAVFAWRFA
jgi:hypothetical protein